MEVQGDVKIIRYGAVPLAKDAICVIDEIGAMPFDDQVSLFNVMEHGEIPLNKQGESRTIPVSTIQLQLQIPKISMRIGRALARLLKMRYHYAER